MFSILGEGVLSHNPKTGAFIPTVTPLNDGTFIAAQQVGPELGSRDHHIEILRSENGRDWTNEGSVDLCDDARSWSYYSAQVYQVSDERWLLRAAGSGIATTRGSSKSPIPACPGPDRSFSGPKIRENPGRNRGL